MNFATHILETCGIHNFLLKEEDVFFSVLAIKWCSVTQLCPILCNPTDCSPPGSSVHGILQARILEWVAISSSRGIFPTQGSNPCLLRLLHWQADSLPLCPLGSLATK